ncbi:putative multiple sugar transport system substrate-binding protein [Sanguibacter gelidistatuariae]|uniref:Putative multiple sugar transport system substrate-binding protein n=1 Tax=Sanguibacter gelidistatuariae TaxID=1814289 RepID=A0A1G6Q265_9MICO|nr:multiple monosaccharide ABC transporter substrate-binding protein [Sanguibacter gelidistatuariae]SDC85727.1 putative multiple sugar transport system substrate-binding protein [Sanguibacter gelidistatuariae]
MNRSSVRAWAAAASAVLVTGIGLGGCSFVTGTTDIVQLVGVAMPTTTSLRWIEDGNNVKAQLEDLGYAVELVYAENDVPTQVAQVEAMISHGADLLIIGSVDGTALKDQLASAAAAGIPIISYDRLIRDSPDVDYYATFDNLRVGTQQATSLLQGLGVLDAAGEPTGAAGPFAIEVFAGSPDDNNATVFYEGAFAVLQPYIDSGVLVIPSGETDFQTIAIQAWDPVLGGERMDALLSTTYTSSTEVIDGILSPYDGISRAVIESLKTAGYGTGDRPLPVVSGQDAELPSVQSIIAGEQYSTIYKDTRQLAEVTVAMGDALLKGAEPETNDITSYDNGTGIVPTYLLGPLVVTQATYQSILVGGGYYTEDELR